MSDYNEFKKDAGGYALGLFLVIAFVLVYQITFLAVSIGVSLVLILLSKLIWGKNKERDSLIKLFVILFFGGFSVGIIGYGYYKYVIQPTFRKPKPMSAEEIKYLDKLYENDPDYRRRRNNLN